MPGCLSWQPGYLGTNPVYEVLGIQYVRIKDARGKTSSRTREVIGCDNFYRYHLVKYVYTMYIVKWPQGETNSRDLEGWLWLGWSFEASTCRSRLESSRFGESWGSTKRNRK